MNKKFLAEKSPGINSNVMETLEIRPSANTKNLEEELGEIYRQKWWSYVL